MRCPKCNYNSFDYNIKCDNNKCNKDWSIQRNLLGLNDLAEPKNINFFDVANARLAEEEAAMNAGFGAFPEVDIDDNLAAPEPLPDEPPKPRIIDKNAFPTPDPSNLGAVLTSDAQAAAAFQQPTTGQGAEDYVEIEEISPDETFFPDIEVFESDDFAFQNPVEASAEAVEAVEAIDEDSFPEPVFANAEPVESPMVAAEPIDATIYPQSEFSAAEAVSIDDIFGIDEEFEAVEAAEISAEPVENANFEPVFTEQEASQSVFPAAFPNPVNVETSKQANIKFDKFPEPGDAKFFSPSANPFPTAAVTPAPVVNEELDLQAVEKEDNFSQIMAKPMPVDLTGDETILPVSNSETFNQIKSALEETGELNEKQNVDFTHIPESDETFMISDIDLAAEMAADADSIPAPQPVLNDEFEPVEEMTPATTNEVAAPEEGMAAGADSIPAPQPVVNDELEPVEEMATATTSEVVAPEAGMAAGADSIPAPQPVVNDELEPVEEMATATTNEVAASEAAMVADADSIPAPQPVVNEEFEPVEEMAPATTSEVVAPEVAMAADSTTLATTEESLASMLDADFNLDDLDDDLT